MIILCRYVGNWIIPFFYGNRSKELKKNIMTYKRRRLLVVDDVPKNIRIISEILKDDYKIQAATSGKEALEKIEKVYSKPEVFAQCRNWLSATFKEAKTVSVASSAKAAQMAADEPNTAAIGSRIAAWHA